MSKKKILFVKISCIVLALIGAALSFWFFYYAPRFRIESGDISSVSKSEVSVPDISKTSKNQQATRDQLLTLLRPNDPSSVIAVADAIAAKPALALDCHEIAHDIGHRAYEMYGLAGAMNFSRSVNPDDVSVQDMCAGGYVHGVLEEAALYQPDFKEHPGALCQSFSGDSRAGCFHGIGHALMFAYYRDTTASLTACRAAGSITDAVHCFEGVWMEFFWGSTEWAGPQSLGWDTAAPLLPCQSALNDSKSACFLYVSLGYFRTHKQDFEGGIKLCTESDLSDKDSQYCLRGVGMTLVAHFKGQHLERTEPFATGLNDSQKYGFYRGAVAYALLSGERASDISTMCDLLVTDTAVCHTVLAAQ